MTGPLDFTFGYSIPRWDPFDLTVPFCPDTLALDLVKRLDLPLIEADDEQDSDLQPQG